MIRDFSGDARDTLFEQIDEVTPVDRMEGTEVFLSGVGYDVSRWIGELCITDYLTNVDNYHQTVLDQNALTKSKIEEVFFNIDQTETSYAQQLQSMLDYMTAYRKQFENLACMIQPNRIAFLESSVTRLKAEKIDRTDFWIDMLAAGNCRMVPGSEMYELLEQRLTAMTENRYDGKKDVSEMSEENLKRLVILYEYLNPETAQKMNTLLATGRDNTLTELDKNSIKYIAYTAPEPYRSVYLEYVGSYEIGAFGGNRADGKIIDKEHYYSKDNKFYFTNDTAAFSGDARGAYTTWFHESGHATDCNAYTDTQYFCLNFTTYNEKMGDTVTLQEAIYYDVYNNIEAKIRTMIMIDSSVNRVLDTFMYGGDASDLSPKEIYVRNTVINFYYKGERDDLTGTVNEAASDIYGGVTNLIIDVGYGHRPTLDDGEKKTDESYQKKLEEYRYWYEANGGATGAQSKELFAEYFSYYMTGNEEAIESMREHFPQASIVLDEMIDEMSKEIEKEPG
jgi:hypothetical protein